MKNAILLIFTLASLSGFSQETDYFRKIDSLNSIITKNDEQIKLLHQKNDALRNEIKIIHQEIDSVRIKDTNSTVLQTTHPTVFYSDLNLSKRLDNIPSNTKVGLLEDLGDRLKIFYNNKTGYTRPYGYVTESEAFRKRHTLQIKERELSEAQKNILEKYGSHFGSLINDNRVVIGMTKEMVTASIGYPQDINRSVGSWGVHEQWVYSKRGIYVYFENEKVTSFQD